MTEIDCTYDNAPDNTPGDFHAQINWGDGPQWDSNVGLTSLGVSGVLVKGTHIYQAQGNYEVTLYVTGPDGETVSDTTTQVDVVPLPDAASRPPDVPTAYAGPFRSPRRRSAEHGARDQRHRGRGVPCEPGYGN